MDQVGKEAKSLKNAEREEAGRGMAPDSFDIGMDVSFLDEIESEGGRFYGEDGAEADALELLRRGGTNAIRLRIWNDPPGGYCNLERTLAMAKRIKAHGFRFLLDFHYSDRWADPAHQHKPKAWEKLDYEELKEAVREYTYRVLVMLAAQGTPPDAVQIGNEITPGLLWDDGKVDGEFDTDEQWAKLAGLASAGVAAAREAIPEAEVMIHIDRGGDWASSERFFTRFERLGVDYDSIGLSYYPWWHGTLADLRETLHGLAARFGKPIYVVETAYPWTLAKRDGHAFIVTGEEQLHEGYEATLAGQARYWRDVAEIVRRTPGGWGAGIYWWEPAWIPSKPDWSVGHPNNWSNLTLFDWDGKELPALKAIRSAAASPEAETGAR